jgi:hypothetical protein
MSITGHVVVYERNLQKGFLEKTWKEIGIPLVSCGNFAVIANSFDIRPVTRMENHQRCPCHPRLCSLNSRLIFGCGFAVL